MSDKKDNVISIAEGGWTRFEKTVRRDNQFTKKEWDTILTNTKRLFDQHCQPIKFETVEEMKKYIGNLRRLLIAREVSKQQLFVLQQRQRDK